MRLLRGFVAVVAGYLFMMATVVVGRIVVANIVARATTMAVVPDALPAPLLAANLAVSAFGAVMGGWLAARFAVVAPFAHAVALAALVAAISIMSALSVQLGPQPGWYGPVISVIGIAGVLLGGWLRATAARANS